MFRLLLVTSFLRSEEGQERSTHETLVKYEIDSVCNRNLLLIEKLSGVSSRQYDRGLTSVSMLIVGWNKIFLPDVLSEVNEV